MKAKGLTMGVIRNFLLFERDELAAIVTKLRAPKPRYEANWEIIVLAVLTFGGVFAFVSNFWADVAYAWLAKEAVQALNKKRFFDPLP